MVAAQVQGIIAGLLDGVRGPTTAEQRIQQLCDDLVKAGLPLWRFGMFVRTLHPNVFGASFVWRHGQTVVVSTPGFDILDTDDFRTSPLLSLLQDGRPIRRRIAQGEGLDASPFLRELVAEGVTDYTAIPLIFTDGSIHPSSWSTRAPGGFTDEQIELLHAVARPLACVVEIRTLRRLAVNLLNTYVGNRAGERILAGQIRRGHTDTVNAAIWLSDMRGFTTLSDNAAPEVVVDVLNRYFDCQVPAILEQGGEVLKFMGDGLLAIFPMDGSEAGEVCARTLVAARAARERIAKLSDALDTPQVRFSAALHVGQVLYGNIGGGNRLDFTCIGPAVNLAARIERLAAQLGRTIVASAEFARHQRSEWEHVGEFAVAGFAARQTVLGLRNESELATKIA